MTTGPSLALVLMWMQSTAPLALARDPAPIEYRFEDELVGGDVVQPRQVLTVVRRGHSGHSLITLRRQFVTQLLASVEDL